MKEREVEIRIVLDKLDPLIHWLTKSAERIGAFDQKDFYFDRPDKSFIYIDSKGYRDADEWLRIRLSSGGDKICYKKWYRNKKTGKSLYADEVEVNIEDGEQLIHLLKKLGFKLISVIEKHRETWRYGDFLISCDWVKGLGVFVEIEFSGQINSIREARKKIFELIKEIGLKNWTLVDRGYPWLQWNRKVLKSLLDKIRGD
jgi:predicted adenylyl cyclase CyaB